MQTDKDESAAAFTVDAPYVNRMLIELREEMARLAFLEVDGEHAPQGRAAVTMSLKNLVALKEMVDALLVRHADRLPAHRRMAN